MNIWIDGSGALLEGQQARIAVVGEDGWTVVNRGIGKKTNNEAEYLALIEALRHQQGKGATIYTDSQLLVGHLTKGWKIRAWNLKPLFLEARSLLKERGAALKWIPREQNRAGKLLEK